MVLCVDENSQVQALDCSQPLLPMRRGQVERRTYDNKRHGTTSLFAALDIATGAVIGRCKITPCGISPVVTIRHSAMSSLQGEGDD